MSFQLIFSLLGGLALFLYGMQMMSNGLEAAAGNRMKKILEKLTSNRFLGVIVGAVITALIQSSSATTVMTVGFVNSGIMTLNQAVWIIMGANIGTTITGQLIALDIGELAPLIAFIGVAMIVFIKKDLFRHYGHIIAGLGILFIGMDMMSGAMVPLRESETFVNLVTQFKNPVVGILVGMIFTAIIQSSSASIGILQALALSGLIGLDSAVFVLFGQNIGTCITAVLASIGTSRSAKRTTIIHLLFNLIGTAIFTVVCLTLPVTAWVSAITPDNASAQIANMHTIFNITTTLLLLPLGNILANLAVKILPDIEIEEEGVYSLKFIKEIELGTENGIGNSIIAIDSIGKELVRMADMVKNNLKQSFAATLTGNTENSSAVENTEEYVDYLNKEISKYISNRITYETNADDSAMLSAYFKISGNLERIGDHAMNIYGYAKTLKAKEIGFSQHAQAEIEKMNDVCLDALDLVYVNNKITVDGLSEIAATEQKIDDMTDDYRRSQLERMKTGLCSDEACILYSEMLTDFERIGDHVLNIGQELAQVKIKG